jgi:hypothetical protein
MDQTGSCTTQVEGVLWNTPIAAPTALNLYPYKINNSGQILGSRAGTAFVISTGGSEQVVSIPAGYTSITPNDISDNGLVTGVAHSTSGALQQFVWNNGTFTYGPGQPPIGWSVLHNGKINSQGMIGGGQNVNGTSQAYIRTSIAMKPMLVKSLLSAFPAYANYNLVTVTGISDVNSRIFNILVNADHNGQQKVLKITLKM